MGYGYHLENERRKLVRIIGLPRVVARGEMDIGDWRVESGMEKIPTW